ncbi:MAG: hypothetical protein J6W88_01690 [Bacteroidales bacterium]|nr:hypothetical protein [Bacteroidales bacterium]
MICAVTGFGLCAQKPVRNNIQPPLVLSVGDILSNYGLDSAMVNDTAVAMHYLKSQPQDYVALTNLCVSLRTKAQRAIASIENDYQFRDSIIWLDSNTVLADYSIYEFRLRGFAELMGRMSITYSRLEQQRIEAEKEAARLRAIEEARRQQEERNQMAADLCSSIDLHHRAIITACDGAGVTDKNKLKQLKDLYYSYLMVYNKYDLSSGNATDMSIARLDELNSFQNDLLENVLGQNSLPFQIENFKNVLKVRCEKDNSDIFRSYSKVFKNTTVPVSFADTKEYADYTGRMRNIINIQQRYIQTIELRAKIASGSDAIAQLYGKKYRDVVSSYRDVLRTINTVPAFTTNAESILFIQELESFIEAQQLYLDDYSLLEDVTMRSDSIMSQKAFGDVVSAYREVLPNLVPVPAFKDPEGAVLYETQLQEVAVVQQCYLDVLAMRRQIAVNDDTITAAKKVDRVLAGGYKLLRKQVDLRPSFSTIERGRSFLAVLQDYMDMQELCLSVLGKQRAIQQNDKVINDRELPYSNIRKAYSRMLKAYQGVSSITNNEDLRRYSRQCDYILEMQDGFINLLRGNTAAENDVKLKRETNIDKIKLIIGL